MELTNIKMRSPYTPYSIYVRGTIQYAAPGLTSSRVASVILGIEVLWVLGFRVLEFAGLEFWGSRVLGLRVGNFGVLGFGV